MKELTIIILIPLLNNYFIPYTIKYYILNLYETKIDLSYIVNLFTMIVVSIRNIFITKLNIMNIKDDKKKLII